MWPNLEATGGVAGSEISAISATTSWPKGAETKPNKTKQIQSNKWQKGGQNGWRIPLARTKRILSGAYYTKEVAKQQKCCFIDQIRHSSGILVNYVVERNQT